MAEPPFETRYAPTLAAGKGAQAGPTEFDFGVILMSGVRCGHVLHQSTSGLDG